MTPDIKELVKRLREEADHQHDLAHDCDCAPEATANWAAMLDIRSAADALEAMAGENERLNALIGPALEAAVSPLRKYIGELQELNKAAEAERDRLAGEVERLNKLNDELDTAASERLLRAFAAESERDRLKAALVEQVKQYPDYSDICRKALGGDA